MEITVPKIDILMVLINVLIRIEVLDDCLFLVLLTAQTSTAGNRACDQRLTAWPQSLVVITLNNQLYVPMTLLNLPHP